MSRYNAVDYPDRISLHGMHFHGNTGVLENERRDGQEFVVHVVLYFRSLKAGKTDSLSDTCDYGIVFSVVKDIVETRQFVLIETMAETVSSEILCGFPSVDAVDVRVQKPNAPIEGCFEYMEAGLFRERTAENSYE